MQLKGRHEQACNGQPANLIFYAEMGAGHIHTSIIPCGVCLLVFF